ncbi:hypothetical protein [Pseudomonas sp.]|uniref:hypothetical protein n=1 Tax=Pseudomonas sp. TaxID=306 RepID=UPI0028B16A1B|nr:hypothetical protein [Pseudomonas sp.]
MRFCCLLLALLSLPFAHAASATPVVGGWTLVDQFDRAYTLDDRTQVVLIARSFSTARMVNRAIEQAPAGYLDERAVVFVADIAQVPSMAQAVLIPSMRSAKYRILLDREGRVAERYAGDRDQVQWLQLQGGQVVSERRFTDSAALNQALAELK